MYSTVTNLYGLQKPNNNTCHLVATTVHFKSHVDHQRIVLSQKWTPHHEHTKYRTNINNVQNSSKQP